MTYQKKNFDFDYEALIAERCAALELIHDKVVKDILVNIVEPEINIVYLLIENTWFEIHGEIGSEILGIHKLDSEIKENLDVFHWIGHLPILDQFIGRTISRVRRIGEAWNGHGFEFSFVDLFDKTLIVQSIYTGSEPKGFDDCLRIGVGNYIYSHDLDTISKKE